ncbi:G-protein coupled receptor 52-like [Uloborus diversus]|uniref:G-protein coupled receptor 52-like n=1 Tax=Uloborus diversus TaxID=327109 RepID=UPI002409665A|nr:G-protein coupled receptor 52-like [Uloborus diversus]
MSERGYDYGEIIAVYGDLVCRLTGFLGLTLWSVCVYTFMWMSVDRYLAIRKPLRYDVIQTRTRCQCWMVFTWLTSLSLCSPPLLGFSQGRFYAPAHVCMLDLGHTLPYSATLAALVLAPSLLTATYAYWYVLATLWRLRRCLRREDYATALGENLANPDHLIALVLMLLFWLSWAPWLGIRLYEMAATESPPLPAALHFWLFWLGVADCMWKFFVYLAMSPKFRLSLKRLCLCLCCRRGSNRQQPLIV